MASNLSPAELFKYDYRVEAFLTKYNNQEPFHLTQEAGGGTVKLKVQSAVVTAVKKKDVRAAGKLLLVTDEKKPRMLKLKDLQKTAEFGGKGGSNSGKSISGEAVHGLLQRMHHLDPSYKLYAPAASERGELMVLQDINGYILNLETPIDVRVGPTLVKNVYGANKIDGTPKADIALVTFNERSKKFENSYFISHKLGSDAASFQQYSGVTEKADGRVRGAISKDATVLEFLRKVAAVHKRIVQDKERFYMEITDKALIGKSVYGPEFAPGRKGIDNIHMIAQGNPVFRAQGKQHELSFSGPGTTFAPDVSHFMSGSYTAVLGARFNSGRGFDIDGKRYDDVRILLLPKVVLGGKAMDITTIDIKKKKR